MNKLGFNDIKCQLMVGEIRFIDYTERYLFKNGERTDIQEGYTIDCFGVFQDNVRKAFSVKVKNFVDSDAVATLLTPKIVFSNDLSVKPYYSSASGRVEFSVSATSAKLVKDQPSAKTSQVDN